MNKCLCCYKPLDVSSQSIVEYHETCSNGLFGTLLVPSISLSQDDIAEMAQNLLLGQRSVTGVQPKLSIDLSKADLQAGPARITMVGMWGRYIVKPQTEAYIELPEIEDLTMHLASSAGITVVPHGLIRLQSGQLAYITWRIDREDDKMYHMEDMCQLTEQLTEHKYRGSYEHIAKVIRRYSSSPGLDLVNFYELVLCSFLTGNNDMHLKNFSLLQNDNLDYHLSPAYDLVASELLVEDDDEELALHLNGKKRNLQRADFVTAMSNSGLSDKVIENILKKFSTMEPIWMEIVSNSFLSAATQIRYCDMLTRKFSSIY